MPQQTSPGATAFPALTVSDWGRALRRSGWTRNRARIDLKNRALGAQAVALLRTNGTFIVTTGKAPPTPAFSSSIIASPPPDLFP